METKHQREGPERRRWYYQIFSFKGHWKYNEERKNQISVLRTIKRIS
jgi:hypothetical protein